MAKPRTKPTPKQRKFVDKYLETGNGTLAVLETYNVSDENTAAVMASQNLRKLKVQQLLEESSLKAAMRMDELVEQDTNLSVALGASKDVLDRTGHKPKEDTIPNLYQINVYDPEQARRIANRVIQGGMPES